MTIEPSRKPIRQKKWFMTEELQVTLDKTFLVFAAKTNEETIPIFF